MIRMGVVFRTAWFVFVAGLAGLLSGWLNPAVMGLRGAILGAALALGTAFVHPWSEAQALRGESAALRTGLTIIAVALLATVLMFLHAQSFPIAQDRGWETFQDFGFAFIHDHPATFATSLAYSFTLLWGYHLRQTGRRPSLLWFVGAPVLGALTRVVSLGPDAFLPSLLNGAFPFTLLWLLAARVADPAWKLDDLERPPTPTPTGMDDPGEPQ